MLTDCEKTIIKRFQQTRIPARYKLDDTDNILYIEHVDFDLCYILLQGKKVNKEYVQNEIKKYSIFLSQISILNYSEDEKTHLKLLIEVVDIFIKYNL